MKQFSNSYGFTLIELIIAISVMSFLSTIGIVSYINYNRTKTLDAAVQDLTSTIQFAKSRASSQVKPTSCGTDSLNGYRVRIAVPFEKREYMLAAICGGSNELDTKTFILPKGIKFAGPGSGLKDTTIPAEGIFFPVITLGVQGAGKIVLEGQGDKKAEVSVDSVGTIRAKPL